MSNTELNPQQNPVIVNAGQQGTVNKINKPTSAQVKNIFSRDVIKNPLKGTQVNSDEQRAMQSNKPPPLNAGQPQPGEIIQSINPQLSYNRPVVPPSIPTFNQTIPLGNSPFTSNNTNSTTFGSNMIGSNIAMQQTQKNDFKLTVGESNRPFTSPIQSNNMFPKGNTTNPPPTNILSSQTTPFVNKLSTTIPSGFNNTVLSTSTQNAAAKNLLASINKMQQQKHSVISFNNNQNVTAPGGEAANMTLQSVFKHARFEESELNLQVNPCNIRTTKLLLLNQANKLMRKPTLSLCKLKLSPLPLKQWMDPNQIYYMLYQYSQYKQQLEKIQKLSKTFEQTNQRMLHKLDEKYRRINAAAANVFYRECFIKKISQKYNKIQQEIKCFIRPLLQARKRGYDAYCDKKSDFDLYVANQVRDSIGNLGKQTKEICSEMSSIIENIQDIDDKNGKQAGTIITKLQECFQIIKSDLQQLTKLQNNRQSTNKQSQTNPIAITKSKRCKQLIDTATQFLLQIDQLLERTSTIPQQPK